MTLQIGALGTGLPAVSASTDGKTYTSGAGLKPGSTAVLYAAGAQVATATVSGAGIAIWTLASAATAGAAMTYDGVVTGSAGAAPTVGAVTLDALSVSPGTATIGAAYSGTISGRTPGSSLALSGAGAAGLSVSGSSITGTPTAAGAVDLVETLYGAANTPRTTAGALMVSASASAMTLTGAPPATTQYAGYGFSPTRANGAAPFTYALSAGTLPAGLTLAPNTGTISGAPTATGTTSGLSITVTDSTGATATLGPFSITVNAAAPFSLASLPTAARAYDLDAASGITASGGLVSQWAASAGTLTVGTATTAEQPTLVADGWAVGTPVVRFNGASSGNILRSSTGNFIERRWTLFVAARPNADQNAVATYKPIYETARLSDGLSTQFLMQRVTNDAAQSSVYASSFGGTSVAGVTGFAKGSRAILVDRADGRPAVGNRFAVVNGTASTSASTTAGTTTRTQRKIGGSDDAVSSRVAIDVVRATEINTDQLPGKAEQIATLYLLEGHLASVYGIQGSLRSGHPYQNRAPVSTDYKPFSQNWQQWGNSLGNGTVGPLATVLDATNRGLTVSNGCVGGTTSTQILARFLANQDANGGAASGLSAQAIREKITVFGEMFQNDAGAGISDATGNDNLAQMVAATESAQGVSAGQGRIIIWAQWEGNGKPGGSDPTAIRARNAALRSAYPNYFIDMHRVLANLAASGGAYADADAWLRDAIPSALRAKTTDAQGNVVDADGIHLGAPGYTEAANAQVRFALVRGWL